MKWPARSLVTLIVAGTLPATMIVVASPSEAYQQVGTVTVEVKVEQKDAVKVEEKAGQKVEAKAEQKVEKQAEGKVEAKKEGEKKAEVQEKDEVRLKAVAVPRKKAVPPAVNLEPWMQQLMPQIRPMVRAEIHMMIAACSPTKEQKVMLSTESERILKEVCTSCAEVQAGLRPGGNRAMPDPRKAVAEKLTLLAKEKLRPDQAARFEAESKKKTEANKQTALTNLVSIMDEELMLSADQRAKITESLSTNWDDSWCSSLMVLIYGHSYFPKLPDKFIVPSLNPSQKKAWEKWPKNENQFWGNFNILGNFMVDDDLEVPAAPGVDKAAGKAEDRPAEKAVEKKADEAKVEKAAPKS